MINNNNKKIVAQGQGTIPTKMHMLTEDTSFIPVS